MLPPLSVSLFLVAVGAFVALIAQNTHNARSRQVRRPGDVVLEKIENLNSCKIGACTEGSLARIDRGITYAYFLRLIYLCMLCFACILDIAAYIGAAPPVRRAAAGRRRL
jgi:hypothetical protein